MRRLWIWLVAGLVVGAMFGASSRGGAVMRQLAAGGNQTAEALGYVTGYALIGAAIAFALWFLVRRFGRR